MPDFDRAPRQRAELDACGIGFVAHASGSSSREIVDLALTGLACVRHRQAIAADGISGDGAGLLVPIPRSFFARVGGKELGRELEADRAGVVSAFLDVSDDDAVRVAQGAAADACAAEGIELAGWRPVPIDESHLGAAARSDQPSLWHGIMLRPAGVDDVDAERRAYRARRRAR